VAARRDTGSPTTSQPNKGREDMSIERTFNTEHDVDLLQRTRRTFLFAREQVAANTSPQRYVARAARDGRSGDA
jgi:hypothetical protein